VTGPIGVTGHRAGAGRSASEQAVAQTEANRVSSLSGSFAATSGRDV
jgi:hypothetical protein